MITVIRNDKECKFAHDIYGVKIKEESPQNFKIIGNTHNEGVCLYESPNYGDVARIFDVILEAICNGDKSVLLIPILSDKFMSKEEYFQNSNIYDYRAIDEDHPIKENEDMYGRPLNSAQNVYEVPQFYDQDFYASQTPQSSFNPYYRNSFDCRYSTNVDSGRNSINNIFKSKNRGIVK